MSVLKSNCPTCVYFRTLILMKPSKKIIRRITEASLKHVSEDHVKESNDD